MKLPVVEGSFLVVSVAVTVSAEVSELSDGLLYSYGYCVCYIGNTIRKAVVTVMIGNYIHRVIVIEGSLFSREYGIIDIFMLAIGLLEIC